MINEETAFKRSTKNIHGEIVGFGQSSDAHDLLKPFDNGLSILSSIKEAMDDANIHPS